MFEALENRRFLAVDLVNGVLTVTGTEAADRIEVQARPEDSEVKLEINGDETRYAMSSVTKVVIDGLGGDDFIEFSGRRGGLNVPSLINGGAGNDFLQGGPNSDTINGGDGNDRIEGKNGNDVLSGGNGNDFIQAGRGDDNVSGDAGDDRLFGHIGDDSVNGGVGDDDVLGGSGRDRCKGGRGNDDFDPLDKRNERRDERREDRRRNHT